MATMANPDLLVNEEIAARGALAGDARSVGSGVSWGAILAGGVGAAALSLILLILGTGLGLSSVSPWTDRGVSATTIGISTILWLTFTQLAASGMGGYLAGRLRTRWAGLHTDEVYFRDTAHGFLAWGVATLATAALLTSTVGAIVSGGAQAGASLAGGAASAATAAGAGAAMGGAVSGNGGSVGEGGPLAYFTDSLFRRDSNAPAVGGSSPDAAQPASTADRAATPVPSAEVIRIFANSIRTGDLPPEDVRYLGEAVAQRTGQSQQDAERRVTDTYAKAQATLRDAETTARDAADEARKASAYAAMWIFVSLLIGAFVASLAATWGGRRRDL